MCANIMWGIILCEQYKVSAFLDTKWVVGKIKGKGANQQNKYATVNCDTSYKENLKGNYGIEQWEGHGLLSGEGKLEIWEGGQPCD